MKKLHSNYNFSAVDKGNRGDFGFNYFMCKKFIQRNPSFRMVCYRITTIN